MSNNVRINVIVNIIRTVVLTFLSFITFPWVCRYLGETAVGTYTWANTFVAYFLILAKVGIPNLAIRECVKVRDDKEKFSNVVQTFFLIQLITTLLSFAFETILVFSIPALRDESSLIFVLSINFLTGVFSFEWVFIALEKQFYMSVRSIVALTICAILIVVFVTTKSDILIYAFIAILVTVITTICNLFYVGKYVSFKKTMPYNIKQFIKPLSILCILSLTLSLYNQTDTFILGFIDNSKAQVASYSVGVKSIDIIIGIITALSTVFIPRAAYYYNKEDKKYFNNLNKYSLNICLFIVLPAIITMMILSKELCGLISGSYSDGGEYRSASYVLMTLAAMMITYTVSDIIYGQILLPQKKEKYYMFALLGGTLLNIGMSLLFGLVLFKETPALGVAIGTMLTDALILIFMLAISWEWSKPAVFNKNSLKLLLGNILLTIVSLGVYFGFGAIWKAIGLDAILTAILQIVSIVAIGAIVYIVFLRVLKEDLVCSFARKKNIDAK